MEGVDWKHRAEMRGLLRGEGLEFGTWVERTVAFWVGSTNRMKQNGPRVMCLETTETPREHLKVSSGVWKYNGLASQRTTG